MHLIHHLFFSSPILTLTIAQPTTSSQAKRSWAQAPTLDHGVPSKGVTCATSQEKAINYTGTAIVAAINNKSTADWVYYQKYGSPPPGQFTTDQIGNDTLGRPYAIVWPANSSPADGQRPMYPVAIGTRDYALYQTTEPEPWLLYKTPTSYYCGVVTSSDAPASAGDAQTLADIKVPSTDKSPLTGLHQCNEN